MILNNKKNIISTLKKSGIVENKGLADMTNRLRAMGGIKQQNRMINDKLWSLKHAVKYSYQGARVKLIEQEVNEVQLALINPDKLKQGYDDKVISIDYDAGYKVGDVFDWLNTGSKWIIYLQDLTELAYFKAEIRRCRYQIPFKDDKGELHTIYAAVSGPTETAIKSTLKDNSLDNPNHSLDLLMPKDEYTLEYFKRYAKFYMRGFDDIDKLICWRVTAVDSISMPGILNVTAQEYYINEDKDDLEQRIVDGAVVEPIPSEPSYIKGPDYIKPKVTATYNYVGRTFSHWTWDETAPVEVTTDGRKLTVKWTKTFSGQFKISCGDTERIIIVESLF